MFRVRQEDLPLIGSSHIFVGADNGDVKISVFLLNASPEKVRDPTTCIGDSPLIQVDVHLSPVFIQENLGW